MRSPEEKTTRIEKRRLRGVINNLPPRGYSWDSTIIDKEMGRGEGGGGEKEQQILLFKESSPAGDS